MAQGDTMKTVSLEDFKKDLLRKGDITKEGLALAGVKLMLAELLYNLRKRRKISQKKLAAAIGVSQPFIARVEGGETNLTIETIVKILSALRMSLHIRPQKRRRNEELMHIAKAA